MAITTYAGLKTEIITLLDRTDLTSFTGGFISSAESLFNLELRHRRMEEVTDLAPTAGVCTLPADFMEARRVVEKASPRRELAAISMQAADQYHGFRQSGLANDYTIVGSSLLTFPLANNDIELTYYQRIPALSDSNTSNWLLDECPELYLRASQVMALEFIGATQTDRFQVAAKMTTMLIAKLNAQSAMSLYSKAGLRMQGATP
jgi:hypothetical protein